MEKSPNFSSKIDEFISAYPEQVRTILEKIRLIIHETIPGVTETISYGIPTFDLLGRHLVHFSAYKKHIGFYPASSGIEEFKDELAGFKTSRGAVQFPIDQPIPYELIINIVKFREEEEVKRSKTKKVSSKK